MRRTRNRAADVGFVPQLQQPIGDGHDGRVQEAEAPIQQGGGLCGESVRQHRQRHGQRHREDAVRDDRGTDSRGALTYPLIDESSLPDCPDFLLKKVFLTRLNFK